MRSLGWTSILLLCLRAWASDTNCPRYPSTQREADRERIEQERALARQKLAPRAPVRFNYPSSNNFIDDEIFGALARNGIPAAPLSGDAEFLRRVTLDLTGRIPTPEDVEAFLADPDPTKRQRAIDRLLNSPAFVDQWTLFFLNHFEVTSRYYNLITIPARNSWYRFVRDFVERDRPWSEFTRDVLTSTGNTMQSGPGNFFVRNVQNGDPEQDTWDAATDRITTRFLGLKTECVSCHDGRRHLEEINWWLTARRREEFWRQSAFLSRMQMARFMVDPFNGGNFFVLADRAAGSYHTNLPGNNPGMRPPRSGGPYEPSYIFNGAAPTGDNWRAELARMLTADRQFARALPNYLWAHLFTIGIVDPPDSWDLARIDPSKPPPAPWTIQPSHPALIERLADEFIRANFSVKHMVRLLVSSNAYQLSSKHPDWKASYERFYAKKIPRRMSAEEIYDALTQATMTQAPMVVEGFEQPVERAAQLPDVSEPRSDFGIQTFLNTFGRGDYWEQPRSSKATVIQILYWMNDNFINFRTFGNRDGSRSSRTGYLMALGIGDAEAVRHLFLATLGRPPEPAELDIAMSRRRDDREAWLADLQWALLNKVDFIFNY